jgi:hypothetical protein
MWRIEYQNVMQGIVMRRRENALDKFSGFLEDSEDIAKRLTMRTQDGRVNEKTCYPEKEPLNRALKNSTAWRRP